MLSFLLCLGLANHVVPFRIHERKSCTVPFPNIHPTYIMICLIPQTILWSSTGHSVSSEPYFQHSDPRMKLSICEAKIMHSFVIFFKILKRYVFFKNANFKNILNGLWNKTKKNKKIPFRFQNETFHMWGQNSEKFWFFFSKC
jgi:hypothetical protein